MARAAAVYEVVDRGSGDVLSRHKTRQPAVVAWRLQFSGREVQIWPRAVPHGETLVVEGVWHEAQRPH